MARNPYLPRWTKRVFTETRGRDPLGLSRVSALITDYLLTGIITQTNRARYYSFFCWALWNIEKAERMERYADFVSCFQRREASVALATIWNNPDSAIAGVDVVRPMAEGAVSNEEVDCQIKVLPGSSELGAYGQYYGGSLYALGLTCRTEDGIDRVTEGRASELAQAFQEAIAHTPYWKEHHFGRRRVPWHVLQKAGQPLSLDALGSKAATSEREKLVEMFFALGEQDLEERAVLRRQTLGLLLDTVQQYEAWDKEHRPTEVDLEWHLVYAPYYFGRLWIDDETTRPYSPPKRWVDCRRLWRQFCLQQFLTQALEGLLYAVLEAAGAESAGLPLEAIVERMMQPPFYGELEQRVGGACLRPSQLARALGLEAIPDEPASARAWQALDLAHPASEWQLTDALHEKKGPALAAARAVLMLSALYAKWRCPPGPDRALDLVANKAGQDLWIGAVLRPLDALVDPGTTWETLLHEVIKRFVVERHDRVMFEKKRLDSCWLRTVDGRVVKDQDYSPRYRSSRHPQATRILCDLGLLAMDGNVAKTTRQGRALLARLEG